MVVVFVVWLFVVLQAFVLDPTQAQLQRGAPHGACGMRARGSCMGPTYNPGTKAFCCRGEPYPCPTPAGWACCGKALVRSHLYMCCSNDPVRKMPNVVCCDKKGMDSTQFVCCDGEIRPKLGPKTCCCRKKPYNTATQVCCGNKDIVWKRDARYNLACAPGNDARSCQGPSPGRAGMGPPPQGFYNPPFAPNHNHHHPPGPMGGPPPPGFNPGPPPPPGYFNQPPPPPHNFKQNPPPHHHSSPHHHSPYGPPPPPQSFSQGLNPPGFNPPPYHNEFPPPPPGWKGSSFPPPGEGGPPGSGSQAQQEGGAPPQEGVSPRPGLPEGLTRELRTLKQLLGSIPGLSRFRG